MIKHKLIGYVNTKDLKGVTEEDAKSLDIINIAFGNVVEGKVVWEAQDAKQALERIRQINADMKVLLSVGGWSSGGFSEAAATPKSREIFIETAIDIMKEFELDGLDLDWEYPSYTMAGIKGCKADKENFTALLRELREAFDKLDSKYYMLTIAAGGGDFYLKGVEIEKIVRYLDYIQLMTYDLRGGFQVLTGHHTNLYSPDIDLFNWSVDNAVEVFSAAGASLDKLVIGVAFYSRMWKGVPDVDHGYVQMAETVGSYGPSYGQLVSDYVDKNGFRRYWDDIAKAPWLFNGDTFISYDDKESIGHKIQYMKDKGLYGVMYWEYCCDETYTLTHWMGDLINPNNQ